MTFSMFDSYVKPNLASLITNEAKYYLFVRTGQLSSL